MISQLPIVEGDKVVIIPIRKVGNVEIAPSCYSNTFFKPLPIILHGKYNDYGSAYDITGDTKQFIEIVNILSNTSKEEVKEYYKKNHGSRVTLIESYITYVERENIPNFNFVMIHEELFDILKNFNDYCVPIDEIIERTYLYNNKKELLEKLMETSVDEDSIDKFKKMSYSAYTHDLFPATKVPGATTETIKYIMYLDSAISVLRKMWIPQSGSGGQCGVEQLHEQLCSFYNKYITNALKEDEEED